MRPRPPLPFPLPHLVDLERAGVVVVELLERLPVLQTAGSPQGQGRGGSVWRRQGLWWVSGRSEGEQRVGKLPARLQTAMQPTRTGPRPGWFSMCGGRVDGAKEKRGRVSGWSVGVKKGCGERIEQRRREGKRGWTRRLIEERRAPVGGGGGAAESWQQQGQWGVSRLLRVVVEKRLAW